MRVVFGMFVALFCSAQAIFAQQTLTQGARVDPVRSQIEDGWFGKTTLNLGITRRVPYRVFMLQDPARLVVDFHMLSWADVKPGSLATDSDYVAEVNFGPFQPEWSRLVLQLKQPMLPSSVSMPRDDQTGLSRLQIVLEKANPEDFAAHSGTPADPEWARTLTAPKPVQNRGNGGFVVVLDPGHGGIDPGAQRDGVIEKDLMLNFALDLAEVLRKAGVEVVLTREDDIFVSLERRVALAHQVGGSVFISLHADSLRQGRAKGATVYTLSEEASSAATAYLAARHDRSDIIAGLDLSDTDDQVAKVLLDLARTETEPRSLALAQALVSGMQAAGGPMNKRPLRQGGFSVLKSADMPSVLVEIGFLSSKRDLDNLRDPVWRAGMVDALASGIAAWHKADKSLDGQ